MSAPEIVRQLVKRFEQHRALYRSRKYNETQLRRAGGAVLSLHSDGYEVWPPEGQAKRTSAEMLDDMAAA
jgi:hypothetical protein